MSEDGARAKQAGQDYLRGQRIELGLKTASLATNVAGVVASSGIDPVSLIGTIHGIQDVASNLRRQWHSADQELARTVREMNDLYRSYNLQHAHRTGEAESRKSIKPSLKQVAAPVADKIGGKFVSAVTNKDFIATIAGVSSRLDICKGKASRLRSIAIYLDAKASKARSSLRDLEDSGLENTRAYRKIQQELDSYRFSGKSIKRHGIRERYTVDSAIEKADDIDRQIAAAREILKRIRSADINGNATETAFRATKLLVTGITMVDGNFDVADKIADAEISGANLADAGRAAAGYGNPASSAMTSIGYAVKCEEGRAEVTKVIAAGKKLTAGQREQAEEARKTIVEQSHGRSTIMPASYQLPRFDFEIEPSGPLMQLGPL